MRRIFTLLIGLSALFIAGCAATFSVRGLGLLFAGSAIAVMTMAASLELGKLVGASFLYRYWHQISFTLKVYLTLAVGVLMCITSLGIYGYLAQAYESTQTKVTLLQHQIDTVQQQINDTQQQIAAARGQSSDLNQGNQKLIDQQQKSIADANQLLNNSLTQLQNRRQTARDNRDKDIALLQQQLTQADQQLKTSSDEEQQAIDDLNTRLAVLDRAVDEYTKQGGPGFLKSDGVFMGQRLRQQQKPERDQIADQIQKHTDNLTALRKTRDTTVGDLNAKIDQRQKDYAAQIAQLDQQEKQLRSTHDSTLTAINAKLASLQSGGQSTQQQQSDRVDALYQRIRSEQDQIGQLRDQIAHTDVGTYSFVARALGMPVDQVVKWLILIIVLVFDPLAVTLTIGFNVSLLKGSVRRRSEGGAAGRSGGDNAADADAVAARPSGFALAGMALIAAVAIGVSAYAGVQYVHQVNARAYTQLIPRDSFAVMTVNPTSQPQTLSHEAVPLMQGLVPQTVTEQLADLVATGLHSTAPVYFFCEYPHHSAQTHNDRLVLVVGMVAPIKDRASAEAALWKFTQSTAGSLLPKGAVAPGAVRSMIEYGRGRYLDPEGGFFTFGLTDRAAVLLLELDGDPQHPVLENEMRYCLEDHTDSSSPLDSTATLPDQALATHGAASLWFDGERCFSNMPKNSSAETRYQQLRPYLAFNASLALDNTTPGQLHITGQYQYAVKRFTGVESPGPMDALRKLGNDPAAGTPGVLMDRCAQTLDFDSIIAHLRSALSHPGAGDSGQVVVDRTVESEREAAFHLRAPLDTRSDTPLAKLFN